MREPPGIQKCDGRTDGPTDRPTDTARCRVARPRLKMYQRKKGRVEEKEENEQSDQWADVTNNDEKC